TDPANPDRVIAGLGGAGGVMVSTDRGAHWANLAADFPAGALADALLLDPAAPDRPIVGVRYVQRRGLLDQPGTPAVWQPITLTTGVSPTLAWRGLGRGLTLERGNDGVIALARLPGAD